MTLPRWSEGAPPPKRLLELRDDMGAVDVERLAALGCTMKSLPTVGFKKVARFFLERRIEMLVVEAIGQVLTELRDLAARGGAPCGA